MAKQVFDKAGFSSGWAYAGLGFEFVGLFLGCTALGWWLDQKFWPQGGSLAMLGGVFLGFAVGLYHVLLRTRHIQTRNQQHVEKQKRKLDDTSRMDQLEHEIDDVARRIDHFVDSQQELRSRKSFRPQQGESGQSPVDDDSK